MRKINIIVFLLLSCMVYSPCFAQAPVNETITLTTYYPSPHGVYKELRAKRMTLGDAPIVSSGDWCWQGEGGCLNEIAQNVDLYVQGNIFADTAPTADEHLTNKAYVDAAVAGHGCYVSYINDVTDGACVAGFSNMGPAGDWGDCLTGTQNSGRAYFRPPGGGCSSGAWTLQTISTAYVCCAD